jgi:hypothetical protein
LALAAASLNPNDAKSACCQGTICRPILARAAAKFAAEVQNPQSPSKIRVGFI